MVERGPDMRAELDAFVAAAHARHDERWVARERFEAFAVERADASNLSAVHAADLYAAIACGDGVVAALEWIEREHMTRVGEFVGRIDATAAFADEVRQRLRLRLLVRTEDGPPRILTYSGAGPLGGWLRVCAVREARSLAGQTGKDRELGEAAAAVDLELGWLKERYGALVSAAFTTAIDALSGDERTMLKMHYVDGLTLEQVASVLKVHRATGARALAKARASILDAVRAELKGGGGLGSSNADSLLAFVRSRIELDLARHLG